MLRQDTAAIDVHEAGQHVDVLLQLFADVGLIDLDAVVARLHEHGLWDDVLVVPDRVFKPFETLERGDPHAVGVEDEAVAGDAGGLLVGLREAAVDEEELAFSADGRLALGRLDRGVAVDDVGEFGIEAELVEDDLTAFRRLSDLVVRVPGFGPGGLVGDYGSLASVQVDLSAMNRRSNVVIFSRAKVGAHLPHHRNHMKSWPR